MDTGHYYNIIATSKTCKFTFFLDFPVSIKLINKTWAT